MRALAVVALCLLPALAPAQSRFDAEAAALLQEGLIETADAFVLPAYTAQAAATEQLSDALALYCAGESAIDPAHGAFVSAFLAWQRASVIQIGPIAEAEGPMRVQLWPDPKGFAQRATRAALRSEDPALLSEGGLVGRSIALTNMTALEVLLYNDPPPDSYACDLSLAIGRFQATLAAGLVAAWTPGSPYRESLDSAADGNALYPNIDAALRELLAGGVVAVDRLRKFKLQRGLGAAPGATRPERTEARLSGAGLQSIEASFRALADLYNTPFGIFDNAPDIGGSLDYLVLAQTAETIADRLAFETRSLSEIAAEDGAVAAELRGYAETLAHQESFLKSGFLASLGMTAGFTAADGD